MLQRLKVWIPVIIIYGLLIFQYIFICWVLFVSIIMACSVWFGVISIFKKKLNIKEPIHYIPSVQNSDKYFKARTMSMTRYKLKVLSIRIFGLILSLGTLYIFIFVVKSYNLFLDLPNYFKNDFKVIVGSADISTHSTRGFVLQRITIDDVKLENHNILKQSEYQGKLMKVYYLPHSKYVLEIWLIP